MMRTDPISVAARHFRSVISSACRTERGQTLVEYSLLIALVSIGLVGSLGLYQGGLSGLIQGIVDKLVALFA